jgi:hypothetical protein
MIDPLAAISDAAEALCDPSQHRERAGHMWSESRHKIELPDHVGVVPGLIQQLRDLAEPGTAAEGPGVRAIPDSRPPGNLDAVSLVAAIEYGSAKRVLDLIHDPDTPARLTMRDSAEGNIRGLVGVADQLGSDRQRVIASELQSWRHQAEVITEWRADPVNLIAPCPAEADAGRVCGERGLLANPDTEAAWCVACGARWSPEETDGPAGLFAYVREWVAASRAEAAQVRERVRAAKAAQRAAEEEARRRRSEATDAA